MLRIDKFKMKYKKKAIAWAIEGMHFDFYLKKKWQLNAYGKYFLYLEMLKATQIIACYDDNEFVGLLISKVKEEKKVYHSFFKFLYVKFIDLIQHIFFKGGVDSYNEANKKMLEEYKEKYSPDGEIIFLAADKNSKTKGIGTFLLNEYEKRENGKEIYLFTDNMCTYQFYDHRGFERFKETNIKLKFYEREVDLTCMLYRKIIT